MYLLEFQEYGVTCIQSCHVTRASKIVSNKDSLINFKLKVSISTSSSVNYIEKQMECVHVFLPDLDE